MMFNLRRLLIRMLCLVLAFPLPAVADDTDIFNNNTSVSSVAPNILIILDNSANWSASFGSGTKFSAEIATITAAIGALSPSTDFNLGLMLFAETGPGTSDPKTAYIKYAVRNMTGTTLLPGNKDALMRTISALDINNDKANNAPYGFGLFEAFKYFGGGATTGPADGSGLGPRAFGGFGQPKRDYRTNSLVDLFVRLTGNAFNSPSSQDYVSPVSDACQKNYVIYISNGLPQSGADSGNPNASTLLQNVGGAAAITTIPLSNSVAQGNIGDEYARFLYNTDVSSTLAGKQNIVTFTVNVYDDQHVTGNDTSNIILLNSMANQGGGAYFAATDTNKLRQALDAIFKRVQSVNSVFASVTLPVSVNVRGTNLNQIYLGGFRPDPDGQPRWFGNLKQYQLSIDATSRVFLADSNGLAAEDTDKGFIVPDAVSFWTSPSTFWAFRGDPLTQSDSPDGPVIEKGGAAEVIRKTYPTPDVAGPPSQFRNIYTCDGACPGTAGASLASFPFNATHIAPASNVSAFGAVDSTEVASIIDWVRGKDNAIARENLTGTSSDIRPSVHGDVLHSRPAVVNYNRVTGSNNDVVIFYGANDGLFRAVKGGQGASDGFEKWAFVPTEFFSKFKRLRDNLPAISPANPKPYFADGSVGVFQLDVNNDGKLVAADGDKVFLYITMRRGGRFIYAIDVSDPDTPKFMWKRDNTSAGYAELGQTWSEPKVRKIRASANPVLIFGAGYDPAVEDQDPIPTGTTNTMGRGIFVVDGITGNVLWQAGPVAPATLVVPEMTFDIPSDIAVLDRNSDGFADRLYVGDTGGNVWRADIDDPVVTNWRVNKLASLGFAAAPTVDNRRKFLFSPDVVFASDGNGPYDAVTIGSGDREHPFNGFGDTAHPLTAAVTNRFYMIKDRTVAIPSPVASFTFPATVTEADLFDTTSDAIQAGTGAEIDAAKAALLAAKGWFITLLTGEKVIGSSVTLGNATFFNTNQPVLPDVGSCVPNLGKAREYRVDFQNGGTIAPPNTVLALTAANRFQENKAGGYIPSPVGAIVQIGGQMQAVVISGASVLPPPSSPIGARIRTFWNQK
jgi:type IV pilus assembly protein PilY1